MLNIKANFLKGFLSFLFLNIIFNPVFLDASTLDNQIDINGHKISAKLYKAPLNNVLKTIAEKANITFIIDEAENNIKISNVFENKTLMEGLRRILTNINHSIVYDKNGEIKTVIIFTNDKVKTGVMAINNKSNRSEPVDMLINQHIDRTEPDGKVISRIRGKEAPEGMVIHQTPDKEAPEGMVIHQTPDKEAPEGMVIP